MARGFGVSGVGATDLVTTALATDPLQRSWFIMTSRVNGDLTYPSVFHQISAGTNELSLYHNKGTIRYEFHRQWTTSGDWKPLWSWTPADYGWVPISISYDASSTSNDPVVYQAGVLQTLGETGAPSGSPVDLTGCPLCVGSFDGSLAEFAVWDAILTADEHLALADGISPALIRPDKLVEYVPMVRDLVSHKRSNEANALLLHMDGADGATTFRDELGHTVTNNGSPLVEVDTGQNKFGGASGYFSGAGYLRLDGSNDFAFGTGDFTIDFWMRMSAIGSTVYDQRPDNSNTYPCPQITTMGNTIYYYFNDNYNQRLSTTEAVSIDTWYHIAIARAGNATRLFLNGVKQGSDYIDQTSVPNYSNMPVIGARCDGYQLYNGWLEEFRVVKSKAMWTANFTPPTAPYAVLSANGTLVQPHPRIIMPRRKHPPLVA